MGDSSRADEIHYDLARNRARGLLTLTKQRPPVDVQAIIDLAGIPVVERALPDGTRATIGDVAGLLARVRDGTGARCSMCLATRPMPGWPAITGCSAKRADQAGIRVDRIPRSHYHLPGAVPAG